MARLGIYQEKAPSTQGQAAFDPDAPLPVELGGSAPAGALAEGSKDVAVAGTPEELVAVSTPCSWVVITARRGNGGQIAYGGSNAVDATVGSEVGAVLAAGQSVSIPVADLQDIWIDASVGGEGVSFTYFVPA